MTLQCQYPVFTWCRSTELEKAILGDNGEMSEQCLFSFIMCVQESMEK